MEIRDSVDQRRIAVERFFAVHHNLLAEQGAVVTTYRHRGGRRLGPYYKLACRSNGRQVAVYLGVDDDLIGRVRELLAQLQQTRAERVRLGTVRRILRQHSKAARQQLDAELRPLGLYRKGYEIRGWRTASRCLVEGPSASPPTIVSMD